MILYRFSIAFYGFIARILALWNPKARDFVAGRNEIAQKIQAAKLTEQPVFWLHAASLGEFEQGRPVLEAFKLQHPEWQIVVTFFSPSGYNLRKNYAAADLVCYLPLDSPANAKWFIQAIKPKVAVFVKYEFWYYTLNELYQQKIPTYLICAVFRPSQLFFKPYGGAFLKILQKFHYIFVQKQDSLALLSSFGIKNVKIAGDTRLDRSLQVSKEAKSFPLIAEFARNSDYTFVCGSTWAEDEAVILGFFQRFKQKYPQKTLKIVLAPHEIKEDKIAALQQQFPEKSVRYSEVKEQAGYNLAPCSLLIIDNIGMLASIYRYGNFAYIGGAYGGGLHNIIEAAVFGLPIFFGNKNYRKFGESLDLIAESSAFPVANADELSTIFTQLMDKKHYIQTAAKSRNYVADNQGATTIIMEELRGIRER